MNTEVKSENSVTEVELLIWTDGSWVRNGDIPYDL